MMTSEKPTCQDLKEELLLSLDVGARAASNLTVLRNRKNLLGVDHSTITLSIRKKCSISRKWS
jgi:hypothetical protein